MRIVSSTERGAVSAELAIALLGLTAVLGGVVSVVSVCIAQVQVHDAAAAGARLAARSEPMARVRAAATGLAGRDASVHVDAGSPLTTVRVSRRVGLAIPGAPGVPVTGSARALTEAGGP